MSADNASFAEGASLDFGAGVTVSNVSIASPTALFADLVIADTAAAGLHDVVVHQGNESLTLKQAFELQAPVAFVTQGTLAQGSVVHFTATNLDLTNLYDTTCGASFFGICLLYTGMTITTPSGVTGQIESVEPFRVSGTLYVDLDAESGPISFTSGVDPATQVVSAVGADTEFKPREPVALAANTATTTTVASPFDSHLYSFDAEATTVARFSATPGDQNATPTIYVLPASGHFADLVSQGAKPNAVAETAGKYFAIYADSSGSTGYSYVMRANPLTLSPLPEADTAGANDMSANAQNAGTNTSILLQNASLADSSDVDWIKFTVPAGSASKKVHVVTAGTDPLTDTVVEVYKNAEDPAKLLGTSDDNSYHEDLVSDAIGDAGATTIFVKIYASDYFDDAHKSYVAAIWLE